MTEHEKARAWREARGLSLAQLAELTGYSPITLRWFEKGLRPPNRGRDRTLAPWVWQRYRMACAGVEKQLRSGKEFQW
jgi:transcriptional regulator with XRE-family HTH domain